MRKNGADVRFNVLADEGTVMELEPDVVIVATGGMPNTEICEGEEHVLDVWDVMTSPVVAGQRVLVYDDNGSYPALDAVERLARGGAEVVYASPERTIAVDVGAMNSPAYLRMMAERGVQSRLTERLIAVEETDDGLRATLRNEYSDTDTTADVDAVVVDNGTIPNDELYLALREGSLNGGAVDYDAFVDPLGTLRAQAMTEERALVSAGGGTGGSPSHTAVSLHAPREHPRRTGLRALPDRRCDDQPQRPRRDPRRTAPVAADLTTSPLTRPEAPGRRRP